MNTQHPNAILPHQNHSPANMLHLPAPDPWPQPVDPGALLDALVQLLKLFVVLPQAAAETLALWILHTFAFQCRDVSTYIGIESPEPRCGKSTLLAVLGSLVNRPILSANVSSPAFFHVIAQTRPTLLIDEADRLLRRNAELQGIFNSGYTPSTAYVLRIDFQPQNGNPSPDAQNSADPISPSSPTRCLSSGATPVRFSTWCPKAMASVGPLPPALADRCIIVRMQRKPTKEKCARLRKLPPAAAPLRAQCARFVLDHAQQIASAEPAIPEALNDREADVWEPLLALADLAGGDWPQRARHAAVQLSASTHQSSPFASLLMDIFVIFTLRHAERMFSRDLVSRLNSFSDHPWAVLRRGKDITEAWLAHQLHPYGIHTRTLWQGNLSAKGYVEADFHDVFRRYITKADLDALRDESKTEGRLEVSPPPPDEAPPKTPEPSPAVTPSLPQLLKLLKAAAKAPGKRPPPPPSTPPPNAA